METYEPQKPTATCPDGHVYPAMAGPCPYHQDEQVVSTRGLLLAAAETPLAAAPAPQAFVDSDFVVNVDNGKAPRWYHDFGYVRKVGLVNHIPVCRTLEQLTNYFNSGSAQGSTHFGIGRDQVGVFSFGAWSAPVAYVHQYMPVRRSSVYSNGVAPWAQGVIARNAACPIAPTPAVAGMTSGQPNGAFHSIENVAMSGADGVTDAQFNSNVLLRAYLASLDGYDITPLTQLWHAEIDQLNRCSDPGWSGDLEDAMQEAARAALAGDLSKLRSVSGGGSAPPAPAPAPTVGRETRLLPVGAAETIFEYTDVDDERLMTIKQRVKIVRDA